MANIRFKSDSFRLNAMADYELNPAITSGGA